MKMPLVHLPGVLRLKTRFYLPFRLKNKLFLGADVYISEAESGYHRWLRNRTVGHTFPPLKHVVGFSLRFSTPLKFMLRNSRLSDVGFAVGSW